MEKEIVAAASCYTQKYFFNTDFEEIPTDIRNKIRVIVISLSEKIHGIFTIGFYKDGKVFFEISGEESDVEYDEIGGQLEIERLQKEEKELLKSLQLWYRLFKTEEGKAYMDVLKNSKKDV